MVRFDEPERDAAAAVYEESQVLECYLSVLE
jgi:hypothetical protein